MERERKETIGTMKLTRCRKLGRYVNPETGRAVTVWTGFNPQRGTDHKYYLFRYKRMWISDRDFYWKLEEKSPSPK